MIYGDWVTYWIATGLILLAGVQGYACKQHPQRLRPQLAIAPLLVQLVVFVITSLISRALAPKPKPPEPGKAETPDIKEGRAPVEIFGAVWLTESFLAGWKQLDPPEPIKLKQGK
jgi:hypothetical protein